MEEATEGIVGDEEELVQRRISRAVRRSRRDGENLSSPIGVLKCKYIELRDKCRPFDATPLFVIHVIVVMIGTMWQKAKKAVSPISASTVITSSKKLGFLQTFLLF